MIGVITSRPNAVSLMNTSSLDCSDEFFYDENGTGLCRPLCGRLNQKPLGTKILRPVSACVGIISAVIVFILALTVQRESL